MLTGEHIAQNITKALELYSSSASQGSPGGQFGMGELLSYNLITWHVILLNLELY